jgi:hypothetical protein
MLTHEQLLALWMDTKPTARSLYKINGCPPMWETLKDGDFTLFTHPGSTSVKDNPCSQWRKVPGVHYQWQRDGKWVGQGCSTTFAEFEKNGAAKG